MEHPAVPRSKCPWVRGRDVWYGDAVPAQQCTCQVRVFRVFIALCAPTEAGQDLPVCIQV